MYNGIVFPIALQKPCNVMAHCSLKQLSSLRRLWSTAIVGRTGDATIQK